MSAKIPSRNELFLRGAGRYLDALAAIEAFQREVQHTCTEVYKRHAAELARQMGLDPVECETYAKNEPEERWAEVGVSRLAQKSGQFYLYLSWNEAESDRRREAESDTPEIVAAVSFDLSSKGMRDDIYDQFRGKNPGCRVKREASEYSYYLLLTSPIKLNELGSADKVLDDLVLEWLGYCKSIGGLNLKKRKTP